MTFETFKTEFAAYCGSADTCSRKGRSYALAVVYIAVFLHYTQIDRTVIESILSREHELLDENSLLYRDALQVLSQERRASYLKNFFPAAIAPLKSFANLL